MIFILYWEIVTKYLELLAGVINVRVYEGVQEGPGLTFVLEVPFAIL